MLLPQKAEIQKNSINKDLFLKDSAMLRHVSPYLFKYDCLAILMS